MKIVSLILIAVIIYLIRDITILKSHILAISNQNIQTANNLVVSSPHPRLLLWSSEVSPNGKYRAASYTGDYADRNNYYQIFVTDLAMNTMLRVYSGDFRTSGWQWTNGSDIEITYDCGTGCRATKVIRINDNISLKSYGNANINEKNGWQVEFFKSF